MHRLKLGDRELSTCQVCGQDCYKLARFKGWWHSAGSVDGHHKAIPAHAGLFVAGRWDNAPMRGRGRLRGRAGSL